MTHPKRACVISGSYYLRDPRVRREAEALMDAGWQVDVICLRAANEPPISEPREALHIHRVPLQHKRGSKLRYLGEYAAFAVLAGGILSRNHFRRRYELVHIHTMPDALVFCAWLPKLTGTPILLDVHDPMPEIYQARFGVSADHWLIRLLLWQERLSFGFADHLLSIHDLMPPLLARSAPLAKFSVVMNVPDPGIFRKNSLPARVPRERFTLVYTGTISPPYGLDVLIQAIAALRSEIPEICLRMVGEGDDRERLERLVGEMNLGDYVEFCAPVPLEEIPALVAAADVAVVSHRRDATAPWCLSTKLVEALYLGLPVIAARSQAQAYYFDETMVAYMEPDDAAELAKLVVHLYRNRELGAQMVMHAGKFFAQHAWEHERARFYDVVERLQHHSKVGNQQRLLTKSGK